MKTKVRLLRRLGQNPEDSVLEKTPTEADWLIANGYAVTVTVDEDAPVLLAADPPRRGRGPGGQRR